MLLNAYWEPLPFTLPRLRPGSSWRLLLDTARPELPEAEHLAQEYELGARSLVVLVLPEARGEPHSSPRSR